MPLPNLSVPRFPSIPALPGVPPILRNANAAIANVVVGIQSVQDAVSRFFGISPAPQWGIFDDDGAAVIVGDSCKAVEYIKEYEISNYPIEEGSFRSYNKVETPFQVKLTFTKGGTTSDRSIFLAQCQRLVENREDFFTVITPEASYLNTSATHYDYRRSERSGAGLLTVDMWMTQVREAPAPAFTQTKDPSGENPVNGGSVQASTVPGAVAQERSLRASGEVRP